VLTVADVDGILARRAYKPGWTLHAYLGDTTRDVILMISARVEDSYHPGRTVPLDIRYPVPDPALASELDFDKWMSWRLQQIEKHEAQEWYRKPRADDLGWVPVFNPHAEGADRDQWPIVKQ
jgi:hypothetical protein